MTLKTLLLPLAATLATGAAAVAQPQLPPRFDISRHMYRIDSRSVFDNSRARRIEANNAVLEAGKAPRFRTGPAENEEYKPTHVSSGHALIGDIDGPDGELWFYDGDIQYEKVVHNEYFTELLPKSFSVNIYDNDMKLVSTISDQFELKEDEVRVRQVDILPIITQKYFNDDDSYELAVCVLVNPEPYGIRPYTYVYSLDNKRDDEGNDVPVYTVNGMVSDVLDASDEKGENIFMTFITEGNKSGLTDEEALDPDHPENYWNYQLGNFISLKVYGKVDAEGNLIKLLDKEIIYYQCQGNQQDDPTAMTLLRDGKPVVALPHYEKVFYKPYYSMQDDLEAEDDNSLIIDLYEQPEPGRPFELRQTTKVPVVKSTEEDVLWSYYGIGGFNYTKDITYDGEKASFIITRSDYLLSDDERKSYLASDPEGATIKTLFENSLGYSFLADLPGFDPQVMFINAKDDVYYYNFLNMRTFETELSLNYGLTEDPSEDPDYILANLDRTLTADGKDYLYAAEMRMPEYDDVNDVTYMRVAWISSKGKLDRIEKINMGNNVNYANLFVNSEALQPGFFHSDENQEYMMLIKRGLGGTTTEQLLIAQSVSESNPQGKDLMLLGEHEEYGALATITPVPGKHNRLSVSYSKVLDDSSQSLTIVYYNLPLDYSGADCISASQTEDGAITFDGATAMADGAIEVYDMRGMRVAAGRGSIFLGDLAKGIYLIRANGSAAKAVVR